MRHTRLGEHGPLVSALGLGCLALATAPDPTALVHSALDAGVTLFDTADYYGQGASETTLGKALARRREQAVIATKTGIVHRPAGPPTVDAHPTAIRTACEQSLRRLGTDHLDLYLLARIDPRIPVEESVGALADLVHAGKTRHIGLCEAAPATLRRAHTVHPLTVVQSEYALWERHVENGILTTCTDLGAAFTACRPLGLGLLTDTDPEPATLPPDDWRHRDPRFTPAHLPHNRTLAHRLRRLAAARSLTAAQLALAWLTAQGTVPIVGTRRIEHLEENITAADIHLTEEEHHHIATHFPPGSAHGPRYPPPLLRMIDT
ncbi:aldo/keto reductase [Streptomyces sp. NPDC006193]|uniref:aldo/keto reductase n=1 Tax=Streptomyces sp. NPDC006193 TaxID=3155717 RepID=UPI0033AF703F